MGYSKSCIDLRSKRAGCEDNVRSITYTCNVHILRQVILYNFLVVSKYLQLMSPHDSHSWLFISQLNLNNNNNKNTILHRSCIAKSPKCGWSAYLQLGVFLLQSPCCVPVTFLQRLQLLAMYCLYLIWGNQIIEKWSTFGTKTCACNRYSYCKEHIMIIQHKN